MLAVLQLFGHLYGGRTLSTVSFRALIQNKPGIISVEFSWHEVHEEGKENLAGLYRQRRYLANMSDSDMHLFPFPSPHPLAAPEFWTETYSPSPICPESSSFSPVKKK